jgi:membrane protease YdiL (CAAX protease family)
MSRIGAVGEILLLFFAFFLPGYVGQAWSVPTGSATNILLLQTIITGVPQFLLMAYVAGALGGAGGRRWGFVRPQARDALRILLLTAACFAVMIPFIALLLLLPPEWTKALGKGFRWGLQSYSQLPLALLFGLTAGYREEFYFRAYLLARLDELALPVPYAVAASTALFCVGHVYEGVMGVLVAAGLGVLFASAYLRRKNLHVIAVAHGLYNTAVLLFGLLLPRELPQAFQLRIFLNI